MKVHITTDSGELLDSFELPPIDMINKLNEFADEIAEAIVREGKRLIDRHYSGPCDECGAELSDRIWEVEAAWLRGKRFCSEQCSDRALAKPIDGSVS